MQDAGKKLKTQRLIRVYPIGHKKPPAGDLAEAYRGPNHRRDRYPAAHRVYQDSSPDAQLPTRPVDTLNRPIVTTTAAIADMLPVRLSRINAERLAASLEG